MKFKRTIFRKLGWSLFEIDAADICNLLAFVQFTPQDDPDVRVINGKEYHRVKTVPSWL